MTHRMSLLCRRSMGLLPLWLLLSAACGTQDLNSLPSESTGNHPSPILGGTPETGWPAVGTLTRTYPGYGYLGTYCTATLIAPQWVLTAGHCAKAKPSEEPFTPDSVKFYVGNDANPVGYNDPPTEGTFYSVSQLIAHPGYIPDSLDVAYDVGLVKLAQPVQGVTPLTLNSSAMSNSMIGQQAFYVGFGVTDGEAQTGAGIKRSAYIRISGIDARGYDSQYQTAGVCSGDSGGPGLFQYGGQWRIIGVNSYVMGSTTSDICQGYSHHTRVDAYLAWINSIINGTTTSCHTAPTMCACDSACKTDGSCDNTLCQSSSGSTCEQILVCQNGCADSDTACPSHCYYQGSPAAQSQYDALAQCYQNHCSSTSDPNSCIGTYCASEYNACIPADNCDITGGSCGAHQACYPSSESTTDCYQSDEHGLNQACDPDLSDRLSCDDGLICLEMGSSATCRPMCTRDQDCGSGESCHKPLFQDRSDIGVCLCTDADQDGTCAAQDCNDTNASIHPGAAEACGDNLDNNCNSQVDENCSSCTDSDHDGFCVEQDCNDNDAQVHPNQAEKCGDSLDNNCNSQVDENCSSCTDSDHDGFCAEQDCNDNDANVHPNQAETCGDNVDNNCNSQVDENCSSCVDNDSDGACDTIDCNDSDPAIHPGGEDICGDGIDNNCDTQVDETCATDPGSQVTKESSGCAVSSSQSQRSGAWLMAGALGVAAALLRRKR